jgi:5-methylcytosine-specific restriction endonuclease McrA
MALSKLEIQQMLREMNVKFHADETYDMLKQRLLQENRSQWLKSVSGDRTKEEGTGSRVVRKKRGEVGGKSHAAALPNAHTGAKPPIKSVSGKTTIRRRRTETDYRPQPIEKPAPGQPWKAVADGTEPFNRKKRVNESVMRRAKMRCERCGASSDDSNEAVTLALFHILPLSQGGEHSIKNVVALCPDCRKVLENNPSLKEIKRLKRKTRSKLYDSFHVTRKTRHPSDTVPPRSRGKGPRKE